MTVLRVALVELKRLTSGVLPVLVLLAMSCIPLLYGALYLYGNWDAYGHVNGIVGALVVEDEGAEDSEGKQVNTGADVRQSCWMLARLIGVRCRLVLRLSRVWRTAPMTLRW